MTEQYLILHKVRGAPAFDIAEKAKIGDEQGWIIPTSGHRAYPHRWWKLDDLADISDINGAGQHDQPWTHDGEDLGDIPDHYAINDRKPKPQTQRVKVKSMELDLTDEQITEILSILKGAG